ncbi:hypothetical protein BV497_08845 [Fulvimonas soli]|nr:hypothetical protein BV497_08845 [Fulvimonas soli]
MRYAAALLLVAASMPADGVRAQTLRQHGPHVHGIATVDVALDGPALQIAVEAPGANLVGFEHPPHDAQERARLEAVLAALRAPSGWLSPAPGADCRLLDADVQPHGYDAPPADGGDAHADIDARYDYRCATPEALAYIDIRLADRYPATRQVVVNLVLPQRQDRQVLGPGDHRVALAP